jgi:L-threonylcarbamoyladenylate synthase
METILLRVKDPKQDISAIQAAASVLRKGGLAAIPTETVYGLAANALDPKAVAKIFQVKNRPADNPLIVHIAELDQLPSLARNIPQAAYDLADAFWPGPLTMILPKQDCIPDIVSAGLDTVAIRFPSHPVASAVIRESGLPIAAPSANLSGSPSPTNARRCVEDLSGKVEVIIDGGDCSVGVESTVITLADNTPRLLRPGFVTLEQLCSVLGNVAVDKAVLYKLEDNTKASSPGMKYKHYAPKAKVILLDGETDAFVQFVNNLEEKDVWALAFGDEAARLNKPFLLIGNTPEEQARNLFERLRELDDKGAKTVYARCPKKTGVGMAVYNRIIRASAFAIQKL